eukprot:g6336.t1
MQGYLDKVNVGDFSPSWRSRYVKVASSNLHMDYFHDHTCAKHRGVVFLQNAVVTEVDLVDVDASKVSFKERFHAFKFVDAHTGKTHFFNAKSAEDKRDWLRAMGKAGARVGGPSARLA